MDITLNQLLMASHYTPESMRPSTLQEEPLFPADGYEHGDSQLASVWTVRDCTVLSPRCNGYTIPSPPKAPRSLRERGWKECLSCRCGRWLDTAGQLHKWHSLQLWQSVLHKTCARPQQTKPQQREGSWARHPIPSPGATDKCLAAVKGKDSVH